MSVVVRTEVRRVVIHPRTAVVMRGTGMAGPTGQRGSSASGVAPIAFNYGDASSSIFTADQDGTFTLVRMIVTTAFDGTAPSLKLGVLGQPEAILAASQNDPATVGEYENTPDLHVAAGTSVMFSITPGAGASQGAGTIFLVFVHD